MPTGAGKVNARGLDFYKRLVDGLHQRGIRPIATLYHWDLPQALQDAGGWPSRDTAHRFADYAAVVARELGDSIPMYTTLNEPWCSAWLGYMTGAHAPGISNPAAMVTAAHHLLLGHGLAVQSMRPHLLPKTKIGITLNLTPCYPAQQTADAQAAATALDGLQNRYYLDPVLRGSYPADIEGFFASQGAPYSAFAPSGDFAIIKQPIDFLGVNYYDPLYATGSATTPQPTSGRHPTTQMGWEIYPRGLYDLLVRLHHDYPAIDLYVTENGAAFADRVDASGHIADTQRQQYVQAHLVAAYQAMQAGVPLKGYIAWAFMDNFEWTYGYTRRFGLTYVDYRTQHRLPKHSAYWYREVMRTNAVRT
jgi:beta-glucosidase